MGARGDALKEVEDFVQTWIGNIFGVRVSLHSSRARLRQIKDKLFLSIVSVLFDI
jgi:hypothetical protein